MALLGKPHIIAKQINLNEKLKKALNFIEQENLEETFERVSEGNNVTTEIDGKEVMAIFQTYQSKQKTPPTFEGHKKYIDLQYIFEGEEFIHVCGADATLKEEAYDKEKDLYFLSASFWSSLLLKAGDAAILYPDDLHAPGHCTTQPARVKKIVLKIAVD